MKTFEEAQDIFSNLNELGKFAVRKAASKQLNASHAGTGHGISSSDVYHTMIGMIKSDHYDDEDSITNSIVRTLVDNNPSGTLASAQAMFA